MSTSRRTFIKTAAMGGSAFALGSLGVRRASAGRPISAGPNITGPAYVLPSTGGVRVVPILTVGDHADNDYRMVGVPDGLGAIKNADDTFTLTMNHELGATVGISRAHG